MPSLAAAVAGTGRWCAETVEWRARLWSSQGRDPLLLARLRTTDVIHIHGLWEGHCALSGYWARRFSKAYVVSPHGMLEPWALRNKWWKKRPYWLLVERGNLRRAACLRALTHAEAEDFHRLRLEAPVVVVPNGVEVPADISPTAFYEQYPVLRHRRLILYLGRLHYKKGLDLLCCAWARVCRDVPEAHLVLAGPDFERTRAELEALVGRLGIGERVTFTGMLSGSLKWGALAAAEVFVLPSRSEGLPVAVLEAMGAGKPVIVTRQCNLPEVGQAGCGWMIEPEGGQLEAALTELLRADGSQARAMGAKGKQLVESRYNWRHVGRQMANVYDWVLGGPRPSEVDIVQ